jgi:hypothetical protein
LAVKTFHSGRPFCGGRIPTAHFLAANPPGAHHIAGIALRAASWLTLLVTMILVAFDMDGPTGSQADFLFGIPALFRVVAWVLFGIRGTHLAWAGALADLMMASVALDWLDWSGNQKGRLLLLSLFCANAIPLWWLATGRQLAAGMALVGVLCTAFATGLVELSETRDLLIVVPILISILASWATDAALLVWAIRTWRERTLEVDAATRE